MDVHELLCEALTKMEASTLWKGDPGNRGPNGTCALLALEYSTDYPSRENARLRRQARSIFAEAAGLPRDLPFVIQHWNDAPERTRRSSCRIPSGCGDDGSRTAHSRHG